MRKIPKYMRAFLPVGPGGPNCACCFPAPGKRKKLFRAAKKRERKAWKKEHLDD